MIGAAVCTAIRSYAEDQNDPVLFAKAKYSPTALKDGRDLDMQLAGQAIYKLANSLAAELKSYSIGSAELDALKAAADKFTLLNPLVRKVTVENKTLLAQVNAKVKEVNNLLRRKLDNSMKALILTQPAFLELYLNARRNYSLGGKHEQPESETTPADDTTNTASKTISAPIQATDLTAALKEVAAKNGNGIGV